MAEASASESRPKAGLRARGDTAYTCEWAAEEQAALEAGLARWPPDAAASPAERYLRIAAGLPRKTARDVALRARWLAAGGAAQRKRKAADEASSKKAQQQALRRERGQSIFAVQPKMGLGCGIGPGVGVGMGMGVPGGLPPMQPGGAPGMAGPMAGMGMAMGAHVPGLVTQPGARGPGMAVCGGPGPPPPYAQAQLPLAPIMPPMPQLDDHGAATVGGVGGPVAALLERNYAILQQFKANMAAYKVHENTGLLVRFRDNILNILNQMDSMQGMMQQMPPLPVRLHVEMANNFLPKAPSNGLFSLGAPLQPPVQGILPGVPIKGWPASAPVSGVAAPAAQPGSMPVMTSVATLPPPGPPAFPASAPLPPGSGPLPPGPGPSQAASPPFPSSASPGPSGAAAAPAVTAGHGVGEAGVAGLAQAAVPDAGGLGPRAGANAGGAGPPERVKMPPPLKGVPARVPPSRNAASGRTVAPFKPAPTAPGGLAAPSGSPPGPGTASPKRELPDARRPAAGGRAPAAGKPPAPPAPPPTRTSSRQRQAPIKTEL